MNAIDSCHYSLSPEEKTFLLHQPPGRNSSSSSGNRKAAATTTAAAATATTIPADIKLPSFYILPKVHKPKVIGRPIVTANSWCLAPLGRFLAAKFHPIAMSDPHVLEDTTDLIFALETLQLDPNQKYFFVTGDVESLYTNIPIALCLDSWQYSRIGLLLSSL